MTHLSAILADDEEAAHLAMHHLLKKHESRIQVIASAHNGSQAIQMINQLKPDLVFLDIQMPDMNGFEVLAQLTYHPYIIFCTAYDQYAIDAFRENSIDYLLKPIQETRFDQCIEKLDRLIPQLQLDVTQLTSLINQLKPQKKATAIPIHLHSKIILVRCEDIVYCKSADGYVSLITENGKEHICNQNLKTLEERLPDNFLRVQKSYIVNKNMINEIHKYFNNRLILIMNDKNHTHITTGTNYIDHIRKELQL